MVACNGHRPGRMVPLETAEKPCRVIDISPGVEHVPDAAEMGRMVVMIDLHAAKIDEFGATVARSFELRNSLFHVLGDEGTSFNI